MPATRTAVIAGSTGLVGRHLLDALLACNDYARVIALVRRASGLSHPKLEERVVDFARLDETALALPIDDVYCCLGTTIRVAGSQAAFRIVDHDYPVALARLAVARGAKRFLLISALGAHPAASVFYNRVKGETEHDIAKLGLAELWCFRPSLLDGERAESRPGERLGLALGRFVSPLMWGSLRRYRPIRAETVARAMLRCALGTGAVPGPVESEAIAQIGA
ncbi:oxidoreductase [Niveibacterium umoris]|uniref:Uncharacterized protein YbjT (DUF2867 family) n=1 Tax=Niveibacterium umoris TaxID=1193620 RepID=A0A840BKP3_9RHOO|nr:oxidoreductase [Niveibacterium umoris]MBB4012148.1 uncharacterized protein YbjT (DUF2867 family) [Niveibacterium umoris]